VDRPIEEMLPYVPTAGLTSRTAAFRFLIKRQERAGCLVKGDHSLQFCSVRFLRKAAAHS
jgi:hypothetical protein